MSILAEFYKEQNKTRYITHEMTICHNPNKLSNWDSRVTRQLGYQQTYQNAASTETLFVLILS